MLLKPFDLGSVHAGDEELAVKKLKESVVWKPLSSNCAAEHAATQSLPVIRASHGIRRGETRWMVGWIRRQKACQPQKLESSRSGRSRGQNLPKSS